jgi:hypothetical protein
MSLSAAPTFTAGSAGNLVSSASLAAGATTTQVFYIGVSGQTGAVGSITTGSALAGRVQVWNTGGGTVASTNGLQVQILSTSDGTNYDTIAYAGSTITTVVSTAVRASYDLPPGQYKLSLTNLDATNAITVEASLGTTA